MRPDHATARARTLHDHTATLTICTKNWNHPRYHHYLLDGLSPRTYRQLGLRLSTTSSFNTTETTQTLSSNCDSTPMHRIRSIKTWHWNLPSCPCHLSIPLSITLPIYKRLRDRRINQCICCTPHQTDECSTRPLLRWDREQGRDSDTPGGSKNTSSPVGISLTLRR